MLNIFKNTIILIFVFLFVTTSVWAQNLIGPRVAKIIVPRAVVYADENLISPLGYIPNGKIIAVGNPRKVNRDIVPTVISGRVAYLELTDIEYQEEKLEESKTGELREHNIDIVLKKPEEKLNENNSVYFSISRFNAGSDFERTILDLEDLEARSWFTSFNLSLLHRKPLSRFFFGVGWEYSMLDAADAHFKFFILNPQIGFTPIRNQLFNLDLFFNLDFSTGSNITIDNNLSDEPSGFLFGPQLGARLITTSHLKYRIFGTLSYRLYKTYGYTAFRRTTENSPTEDEEFLGFDKLGGINVGLGICFDL